MHAPLQNGLLLASYLAVLANIGWIVTQSQIPVPAGIIIRLLMAEGADKDECSGVNIDAPALVAKKIK